MSDAWLVCWGVLYLTLVPCTSPKTVDLLAASSCAATVLFCASPALMLDGDDCCMAACPTVDRLPQRVHLVLSDSCVPGAHHAASLHNLDSQQQRLLPLRGSAAVAGKIDSAATCHMRYHMTYL